MAFPAWFRYGSQLQFAQLVNRGAAKCLHVDPGHACPITTKLKFTSMDFKDPYLFTHSLKDKNALYPEVTYGFPRRKYGIS